MQLERKNLCPLFKSPCKQLDCAWFVEIQGDHPQDGTQVKEWGCAIVWQVLVGLQVAKDVRQGTGGVQAATESFRNEMVRINYGPMIASSMADIKVIENG